MNKFSSYLSDVAVVVGSAVGVGLISGKETQLFVGTLPNALIFAVVFCVVLTVFREFCRKNAISDVSGFSARCFNRFAFAFRMALVVCSFVCVVTCLAGAEQCLSEVLYLSKLPLYAVVISAAAAFVMVKGMSALKTCNAASVVMAIALFVILAFIPQSRTSAVSAPPPYMPAVYALFSFTMSLSVTCKLGAGATKKCNVVSSLISSITIAALLIVTACLSDFEKPLPTLSGISNPYLKAYATFTVAFCCMCSVVACAVPVCELADSVIGDKTTTSATVFLLACAFAMFGFDFLVKYGYAFVSFIGAAVFVAILSRSQSSRIVKCSGIKLHTLR